MGDEKNGDAEAQKRIDEFLKKFGDKADSVDKALRKDEPLIKSYRALSKADAKDKEAATKAFEDAFNKKFDDLLEQNGIKLNGAEKRTVRDYYSLNFKEDRFFEKVIEDRQVKEAAAAATKVGMLSSPNGPFPALPFLIPSTPKKKPLIIVEDPTPKR